MNHLNRTVRIVTIRSRACRGPGGFTALRGGTRTYLPEPLARRFRKKKRPLGFPWIPVRALKSLFRPRSGGSGNDQPLA